MTKPIPHFSAFASSLNPDQRSYVQNYVASAIQELVQPLLEETTNAIAIMRNQSAEIDRLEAQVKHLSEKLTDDTKYILTRGKIVALMKELDIE